MSDSADIQQRDQQLADILAQVTELPADRRPQLQELISTHPHLADELRQLWGTIMVVDAVAEKTSDISPSPAPVSI